jgi:hypothetical protein
MTGHDKTGQASCESCSAGQYAGTGSSTCTDCEAGRYYGSAGAGDAVLCAECDGGRYSTPGAGTCLACLAGQASSSGAEACTPCLAGKFSVADAASSCTNCGVGQYSSMSNATGCTSCDVGSFTTLDQNDIDGVGVSTGASFCVPCPIGFFGAATGSVCTQCVADSATTASGSTQIAQCLCNAGYAGTLASPSDFCTLCNAGKYKAVAGTDNCIDCVAGKYIDVTGSDEASDCIECIAGKYIDVAGSDEALDCIDCVAGKYIDATGSHAASACIDCVAGKYIDVTGSNAAVDCIDCVAGKYNHLAGSDAASDCIDCVAGKYIHLMGTDEASDCIDCVAGKYIDVTGSNEASDCIECVAGKYIDVAGSDEASDCIDCVAGMYTHDSSTGDGVHTGASACSGCGIGRFNPTADALCDSCPIGSNTSGLTAVAQISGCVCANATCGSAVACGFEGTLSQESRECTDVSPPSLTCRSAVVGKSWVSPQMSLSELLSGLTDNSQQWLHEYPNETSTRLQVTLSEGDPSSWSQTIAASTAADLLATQITFNGPTLPVRTNRNITVMAEDATGLSASCVATMYLEAPQLVASSATISATALSTSSAIIELQLSNAGEQELIITTATTRVVAPGGGHPQWADVHLRHQSTIVRVGTTEDHTFVLCPQSGSCTSTSSAALTATHVVTTMVTLDGTQTQAAGAVNAMLEVSSNDPTVPVTLIPVQLDVTELPIVAMVLPTE